jgi:hypothetical protein
MQIIDKTIAGLLEEIAAENPLQEAIIHTEMGVRYDFKHLSREIDRSARGLPLRYRLIRMPPAKISILSWSSLKAAD